MDWCKNNPEKVSTTTKVGENILSGFSIYAKFSSKFIKSKHDKYRGEDCECFKKH